MNINYSANIPFWESVRKYIENFSTSETSNKTQKIFQLKAADETVIYEDRAKDGTLLSTTRIGRYYPIDDCKTYKYHKSLNDLCEHIAFYRNPDSKNLKKETSSASFSSKNRGDLKTETTLSTELKKILGLNKKSDEEIKKLLSVESIYQHNSEFNGHAYLNKQGKYVYINSAIASSNDRKATTTQNLSVLKEGGQNLLYTGRPDTPEKAKEQALFILSQKSNGVSLKEADKSSEPSKSAPKWLNQVKGLTWNPKLQCIEFPYAVYSLMSDSSVMSSMYTLLNTPEHNEKKFIEEEAKTLESLKKEPMLVKDAQGNVFKMQLKPILLSQRFNAFSTLKAFVGEGKVSSALMETAYKEIQALLNARPKIRIQLQSHINVLDQYFMGKKHLSDAHLFMLMNTVLKELSGESEELPLVLHCKSSTDRTGIGAAILTAMSQMKRLGIEIPSDMGLLTKDPRFKALYQINWIPTWHQRSEYSRDIAGISFGNGITQNPIVIECLPENFLEKSSSSLRWLGSGAFAASSTLILNTSFYLNRFFKQNSPAFSAYLQNDLFTFPYYPNVQVNQKGLVYKSKGEALSPLRKEEKM